MTKRLFDVFCGSLLLILTLPLMAVCVLALLVAGNGSVIFKQERVGKHGKPFEIYKFRTMRPDSDGLDVTVAGDPRVTSIGGWLRKSKVDELPQLINVLKGDMSVVGPRPEVPKYVALWPTSARDTILSVRPGITDPASVRFRHESAELAQVAQPESYYVEKVLPEKVAAYVEYVRQQSLLRDIGLIFATTKALVVPARYK